MFYIPIKDEMNEQSRFFVKIIVQGQGKSATSFETKFMAMSADYEFINKSINISFIFIFRSKFVNLSEKFLLLIFGFNAYIPYMLK